MAIAVGWDSDRLVIWQISRSPVRTSRARRRAGSRGATAGADRAVCGPTVEAPRCFLSTLKAGIFSSAQTGLETTLLEGRPHRGMGSRQRLWISITGSSSIRRLKDCPVESGPERARPSRRVGRGRETRAVASPRAACPPTACPSVAASRRLPTFPFVMRRDGGPELVIRGEHPVIAMPVLPRRRHEVSEPVEELKWGKLDDAAGARPRGLPPAPRANPVRSPQ